jgi:hypothetical protein
MSRDALQAWEMAGLMTVGWTMALIFWAPSVQGLLDQAKRNARRVLGRDGDLRGRLLSCRLDGAVPHGTLALRPSLQGIFAKWFAGFEQFMGTTPK